MSLSTPCVALELLIISKSHSFNARNQPCKKKKSCCKACVLRNFRQPNCLGLNLLWGKIIWFPK